MYKFLKATIPMVAILGVSFANIASAADLDGEKLFTDKTCHTCHGKDANTPLIAGYPSIAGQPKEYLVQQIKDIKTGKRNNGQAESMKGIMHLVSDAEIDAIAAYVATLPFKPGRAVSKAPKAEAATAAAPAAGGHAPKHQTHDGTGEKVWMVKGGERELTMTLKRCKATPIRFLYAQFCTR